jgi:outer membrane protein OmpA-like peptidoglycan-associated protein
VAAKPAAGALAAAGSIRIVLFDEARARLGPSATTVIATAVREIKARHPRSVTVVGYTDKIGNPAANLALSVRRAGNVVAAMRRQLKDPSVSFRAEARGEITQ